MAQGDITFYNNAKKLIGDGSIDWDTDSFRISLHNGYTPNIDTHDYWDDVSATEVSLTGYTAGGATLTTSAPTVDTTNDWAEYDATDVTWNSLQAGTLSHAIIRKYNATASLSALVCYIELGTTQPNGGNYTIQFHADGVFKVS